MNVTINDVEVGTRVRVRGYADNSEYVQKLQRLGLVPGTELELLRKAPLGDPVEIHVRGYSLALRPSEAGELVLEKVEQ